LPGVLGDPSPGARFTAQHPEELVDPQVGPSLAVDHPDEVFAGDLQLHRLGRRWRDSSLHDDRHVDGRQETADEQLHAWQHHERHAVDAQRDRVAVIWQLSVRASPDRPVVVPPGWQALKDLLSIEILEP
jgi:hypothetical protein